MWFHAVVGHGLHCLKHRYQEMLLRVSLAHFFPTKNAICASDSGKFRPQYPLPGFCLWTPLRDFRRQAPYTGPPASNIRLRL